MAQQSGTRHRSAAGCPPALDPSSATKVGLHCSCIKAHIAMLYSDTELYSWSDRSPPFDNRKEDGFDYGGALARLGSINSHITRLRGPPVRQPSDTAHPAALCYDLEGGG